MLSPSMPPTNVDALGLVTAMATNPMCPLIERVSRPVLGLRFLRFWPVRTGMGRFMSGLGWFGFLAGVRAGMGRFKSDLGWVQTSPGPAQAGSFSLRPHAGGETACPAHRPPGNQENKR